MHTYVLSVLRGDRCCMQNGTNPKVEVEPVAQHISGPGTVPTTENPLPTPNVVVSYDVKKVRGPALEVLAATRAAVMYSDFHHLCHPAKPSLHFLKQSCFNSGTIYHL